MWETLHSNLEKVNSLFQIKGGKLSPDRNTERNRLSYINYIVTRSRFEILDVSDMCKDE